MVMKHIPMGVSADAGLPAARHEPGMTHSLILVRFVDYEVWRPCQTRRGTARRTRRDTRATPIPARNSKTDAKEHTQHQNRYAAAGPKHLKVMVLGGRVPRDDWSISLSPSVCTPAIHATPCCIPRRRASASNGESHLVTSMAWPAPRRPSQGQPS
jgi:hypothetical protein